MADIRPPLFVYLALPRRNPYRSCKAAGALALRDYPRSPTAAFACSGGAVQLLRGGFAAGMEEIAAPLRLVVLTDRRRGSRQRVQRPQEAPVGLVFPWNR